MPVKKGPSRFHWRCICTGNGTLQETWKYTDGYTLEQALELAKKFGWQIIGL